MTREEPAVTSSWKDSTPLDQTSRQVVSFLFPDRRCIARVRTHNPEVLSLTFWQDANGYVLSYLVDRAVEKSELIDLFDALEDVALKDAFLGGCFSQLSVNLFAHRFSESFLTKLQFVHVPIKTFEWLMSSTGGKDTVLVKEIARPPANKLRNGKAVPPSAPAASTISSESLSSEELSALVQLGMDLRKVR